MSPERFHDDNEIAAYKAGQLDQRLANMDTHFAVINGSITESAHALDHLVQVVVAIETKLKIGGYVAGVFLTAWVSAIAYLILNN